MTAANAQQQLLFQEISYVDTSCFSEITAVLVIREVRLLVLWEFMGQKKATWGKSMVQFGLFPLTHFHSLPSPLSLFVNPHQTAAMPP